MDSPRLGFRRAAVTSWALVGAGIAGVVGASALAYADTVKPAVSDVGADAAIPTREELVPSPGDNFPPPPPIPATTPPSALSRARTAVDLCPRLALSLITDVNRGPGNRKAGTSL